LAHAIPPGVETPAEFDLIGRQETIRTAGGPRYFEVSGGIRFSALTIRLLDGDISALREAVLQARHTKDELSWNVPVGGDWLQTGQPIPLAGYPAPDDAGAHLSWNTGSPTADSEKRKADLKDAVTAIEAGLKKPAFELYHTEDGGATWKLNETPSLTKGTGGGMLCITASCVGPPQAMNDGLKAESYAYGDLSPYSTHRYFEAGYSVSLNGKVISSGWGDVKLLGGGTFAAKEWNGPGYQIMDESGKRVSSRTFNNVSNIGSSGYFSVQNEDGFGTTTIYGPDMKQVRTGPTYEVNSYLRSDALSRRSGRIPALPYPPPTLGQYNPAGPSLTKNDCCALPQSRSFWFCRRRQGRCQNGGEKSRG
jgi:hypothetical protein